MGEGVRKQSKSYFPKFFSNTTISSRHCSNLCFKISHTTVFLKIKHSFEQNHSKQNIKKFEFALSLIYTMMKNRKLNRRRGAFSKSPVIMIDA